MKGKIAATDTFGTPMLNPHDAIKRREGKLLEDANIDDYPEAWKRSLKVIINVPKIDCPSRPNFLTSI